MTTRVAPDEPDAGPWDVVPIAELARRVRDLGTGAADRPLVVAVDGRSGSGKSTIAERLVAALPGAALLQGDDVAWHAPMFGWAELLRDGVLAPLRRGDAVAFTPPAWPVHGREGAVVVASGTPLVVIEGVGVSQRAVAELIDVAIWVQCDAALAEERGLARDVSHGENGDAAESLAFWRWWMAAEEPFLVADRPWERADLVVAGNLDLAVPQGSVGVSRASASRPTSPPAPPSRGSTRAGRTRSPSGSPRSRRRG